MDTSTSGPFPDGAKYKGPNLQVVLGIIFLRAATYTSGPSFGQVLITTEKLDLNIKFLIRIFNSIQIPDISDVLVWVLNGLVWKAEYIKNRKAKRQGQIYQIYANLVILATL